MCINIKYIIIILFNPKARVVYKKTSTFWVGLSVLWTLTHNRTHLAPGALFSYSYPPTFYIRRSL